MPDPDAPTPAILAADALEPLAVHPSLHRPVLFAGVEPRIAILEATTAFALLFGVGVHVGTVLLALFYLTVVHGLMAWIAAEDPDLTALYLRSLRAHDFYAPHGPVQGPIGTARTSIPPAQA